MGLAIKKMKQAQAYHDTLPDGRARPMVLLVFCQIKEECLLRTRIGMHGETVA
jgi:hypothetical protein